MLLSTQMYIVVHINSKYMLTLASTAAFYARHHGVVIAQGPREVMELALDAAKSLVHHGGAIC